MSEFSQGGCDPAFPTKTALKKAIKDGKEVYLYSTSAFDNEWSGRASELPDGNSFNVVGPDPYTNRKWYAIVKRNTKGEVFVT